MSAMESAIVSANTRVSAGHSAARMSTRESTAAMSAGHSAAAMSTRRSTTVDATAATTVEATTATTVEATAATTVEATAATAATAAATAIELRKVQIFRRLIGSRCIAHSAFSGSLFLCVGVCSEEQSRCTNERGT